MTESHRKLGWLAACVYATALTVIYLVGIRKVAG